MGRRAQPQIRESLLDECADYALAHGLPDRLEPFVAATGTSARMLLYHFGSRDALLRTVLVRARERHLASWGAHLRARPDEHYPVTLQRAWTAITGPAGEPYRRMFGLWRGTAAPGALPDFARTSTTDWLALLGDGLASIGRADSATLALAVIRGLLLDLDATADTARADRAFSDFLALLDSPCRTAS